MTQEEPENILPKINFETEIQRAIEEQEKSSETTIAIQMNNPKAWYNRGGSLYQLGRYEEAIASYEKALEIEPDYPDAWNNRGMAFKTLHRYEEALASYNRAIALKCDYSQAWNNRGNALAELGRYEEAVVSYERAIAIKPNYYEAWHNQGEALGHLGHDEAAIACYNRVLTIKPDLKETKRLRRIAIARYQQKQSQVKDKKQIVRPETEVENVTSNPEIQPLADDIHPKLTACDRLVTLYPDDPEAWLDRGNTLSELGRYEEAVSSYDRAIALREDDCITWKNRAIALKQLGQYEEAVISYEKAFELKPDIRNLRQEEIPAIDRIAPLFEKSLPAGEEDKISRASSDRNPSIPVSPTPSSSPRKYKRHVRVWQKLAGIWRQIVNRWQRLIRFFVREARK